MPPNDAGKQQQQAQVFERGRQDALTRERYIQAAETQRLRRLRRIRLALLLVLIVLIGALLWWSIRYGHLAARVGNGHLTISICYAGQCLPAPAHHVTATGPGRGRGPHVELGVHVCAPEHFSPHLAGCLADVGRFALRHLGVVYLSITAWNGGTFTNQKLSVRIGRSVRQGRVKHLATINVGVSTRQGVWSSTLQHVFHIARVSPHAGQTYRIEAADGVVLLGTANFTIVH